MDGAIFFLWIFCVTSQHMLCYRAIVSCSHHATSSCPYLMQFSSIQSLALTESVVGFQVRCFLFYFKTTCFTSCPWLVSHCVSLLQNFLGTHRPGIVFLLWHILMDKVCWELTHYLKPASTFMGKETSKLLLHLSASCLFELRDVQTGQFISRIILATGLCNKQPNIQGCIWRHFPPI